MYIYSKVGKLAMKKSFKKTLYQFPLQTDKLGIQMIQQSHVCICLYFVQANYVYFAGGTATKL